MIHGSRENVSAKHLFFQISNKFKAKRHLLSSLLSLKQSCNFTLADVTDISYGIIDTSLFRHERKGLNVMPEDQAVEKKH